MSNHFVRVVNFIKEANFGWWDALRVLMVGAMLMWLTHHVVVHMNHCN
jgi:hypothetical protein